MPKSKQADNPDRVPRQLSLFDSLPIDSSLQSNSVSKSPDSLENTELSQLDSLSKSPDSFGNRGVNSKERLLLFVPERFDVLERRAKEKLKTIINPVEDALAHLDDMYSDMISAGRGAFLVLRGTSGSGKSTFLHTVYLFRHQVKTLSIQSDEPVSQILKTLGKIDLVSCRLRIIVIENREALTDFSVEQLEKDLHSINRFIRSPEGERTLFVWPCNSDTLEEMLINLAKRIGADSLLGIGEPSYRFNGPPKDQYVDIAIRTIETLNEGASLVDLGVSEERARHLIEETDTIGVYLSRLRQELRKNEKNVEKLLAQEKCRVWIVVIGGNNPEQEVAGLTRGGFSKADISCLMNSTKSNVVEELKKYSDKVGILVTVLEAKIIYLPIATVRSIIMAYAEDDLKEKMKQSKIPIRRDKLLSERLMKSQLARAFKGDPVVISRANSRPSTGSTTAFQKLSEIAQKNDELLNRTIGKALNDYSLINSFKTEVEFRGKINLRSDLLCQKDSELIRVELMWTKWASSGEIANYVLKKLQNYGRAIGLLE